jgi:hypothetical protein
MEARYLLNNIRTELLDREGADVADELTNDCITEPVVIKVQNVLNNLRDWAHQTAKSFFAEERRLT